MSPLAHSQSRCGRCASHPGARGSHRRPRSGRAVRKSRRCHPTTRSRLRRDPYRVRAGANRGRSSVALLSLLAQEKFLARSQQTGENPTVNTFQLRNTQSPTPQGARGPAMSLCSGASSASQACGVGRKNPVFMFRILCSQVTGICEGCGHTVTRTALPSPCAPPLERRPCSSTCSRFRSLAACTP